MADWEYDPEPGYEVEPVGPTVLVTDYEDGSQTRRQKNSTVKRIFRGRFLASLATAKSMLDFLYGKGLATSFTILTWDPRSADPPAEVATVYLEELPKTRQITPSRVELEVEFREA